MSARPGHHNPDRRDQERGEDIRAAARTLARLLRTETRNDGRRGGSLRPRQMGWRPRSGPGRLHGPPPRDPPQETPSGDPGGCLPIAVRDGGRTGTGYPKGQAPGLENRCAAQERPSCGSDPSPRRYQQVLLEERWPRGIVPRDPLRGGPERSANEPQTPSKKAAQQSTKGKSEGAGGKTRPTIVAVEESWGKEKERSWGPL